MHCFYYYIQLTHNKICFYKCQSKLWLALNKSTWTELAIFISVFFHRQIITKPIKTQTSFEKQTSHYYFTTITVPLPIQSARNVLCILVYCPLFISISWKHKMLGRHLCECTRMMEKQEKYTSFIASALKYGVLRVSSDQSRSNLERNWNRTNHTTIASSEFDRIRGLLNLYEELDTWIRWLICFYKLTPARQTLSLL